MVKVERLILNAFRGVPGDLQLDFTSPLTLIYAPNGTGKTSVIDGAEWLLTGEVARLNAFSKKGDLDELRCKFASKESQIEVEGSILREGKAFRLIRSPDDWFLSNEGESTRRRATRPEVMQLLAPEEVGKDTDHRVAPKLRSDWIRSARFLTESTLAVLVDADSQNQLARGSALADFLGVGELSTRSDKFEKYAKYLNDGYSGEEGLAVIKKELTRRNDELVKLRNETNDGVEAFQDIDKLLGRELLAAAKLMDVDDDLILAIESDASLQEMQIAELSAKLGANRQHLSEQEHAFSFLQQYWPEMEILETSVTNAKAEQLTGITNIAQLTEQIDEATQRLARLDAIYTADEGELKDITNKKVFLVKAIQEVLQSLSHCKDMFKGTDLFFLEQMSESQWGKKKIADVRCVLNDISGQLEGYLRDAAELRIDKQKLQVMKEALPSEVQIEVVKRDVKEANRLQALAKERYGAAAGPLEHLRLATERFIGHFKEQADCPVCGHSWNSSENLRAAISDTMATASKMVADLGVEVLTLENKVKDATATLAKFNADCLAVETFGEQIKPLELKVLNFRDKLAKLLDNFENIPVPLDDQNINGQLTLFACRLTMADSLADLRQVLDSGPSIAEKENWIRLPIDQLLPELNRILDNAATVINDRLAEKKREKNDLTINLEKWRPAKAEEQAKLESAHQILSEKLPLLVKLQETWQSLCGERERSEDVLREVKDSIQKRIEAFSNAESHLHAAKRVLDVIARNRRVSDLEAEIKKLDTRFERVEAKRTQAIEAAKLYREKANQYCAEQLDRLFEVAFPIFSRIQANEVFDSIHRGPIDNPFDWIAESLTHTLRPSPHFSMGQRQDLALAIFIARARGLTGTFFLDEPIIHLDDLNRVALLDMFRMLAVESGSHSNFVLTTASRSLVRHMAEKFANVSFLHGMPPLRIYELDGNPRVGVKIARHIVIGKS